MDTSKKYYEDKIRDFNNYRRGRTLNQFCKDEGIDYNWMVKAKRKYSGRIPAAKPEETNEEEAVPSLIELHYEDDINGHVKEERNPLDVEWRVGPVVLTDPEGIEITINGGSAAALGRLLTKLSECHA